MFAATRHIGEFVMAPRSCLLVTGLLLAIAGNAIAHPEAQSADRASAAPAGNGAGQAPVAAEPPSYDSDYAAWMRRLGSGEETPEADGRPGEYYFLLGAHAFAKQDYRFAIQMYEVAASWAYKPAEFNLGVMYARGQGVAVDLPRAMAWMALAAERSDARYVDARETIYATLSKEQFEQANAIWRDLKKTYGDEIALRRAKARWADVRAHITGSRVGFVGHLDVGVPSDGPTHNTIVATSSVGLFGGNEVDGSTAYKQLLQSDNPYDPKFERPQLGTATVEPLVPVTPHAPADKAEPARN
jgi:hypothetical protein